MKKIIILSAVVALFVSCMSEIKTKIKLKGYRFQNEYAVSDSIESEKLTKDITIDIYLILHTYPDSWTNVVAKMKSDSECEFCFRIKDSKKGQFFFGDGTDKHSVYFVTDEIFELDTWQRITLVRDMGKGELKIYANGELKAKKTLEEEEIRGPEPTNSPIYVGSIYIKGRDMTIADVKIWCKVMSDNEILKGWEEIKNPDTEESLVTYWSFEDLDDNRVENLAGSDLTLTIKEK
ncbi:MAG TPA: hypothetical protein PLY32_00170 [Salinivirgaceae bacterium]|nr:hypothetical protein [Salinivirgaceae bacterium]HQA75510.1 hypothetical protein [Salinivirgaceae bacterium]